MPNFENFNNKENNTETCQTAKYNFEHEGRVIVVTHIWGEKTNQLRCDYKQWTAVYDIIDGKLSKHPVIKDNSTGQIISDEKRMPISKDDKSVIYEYVNKVYHIRNIGKEKEIIPKKNKGPKFTEKRFIKDAQRLARKEEERTGVNPEDFNDEY